MYVRFILAVIVLEGILKVRAMVEAIIYIPTFFHAAAIGVSPAVSRIGIFVLAFPFLWISAGITIIVRWLLRPREPQSE